MEGCGRGAVAAAAAGTAPAPGPGAGAGAVPSAGYGLTGILFMRVRGCEGKREASVRQVEQYRHPAAPLSTESVRAGGGGASTGKKGT